MCRGRFCGEPRRGAAAGGGRAQPAGARAAGPLRGVGAGALWWGRMVRGGRPASAPAEGRGRGRPGAAPTPPQAAARRAVGAGEMLGRGRGGCGAGPRRGPPTGRAEAGQSPAVGAAGAGLRGHPASAERRMVIAEVVRRPPGHGRCRRWPAGFWCADGGHWGPCPAHREPLPPHGHPSWKGS